MPSHTPAERRKRRKETTTERVIRVTKPRGLNLDKIKESLRRGVSALGLAMRGGKRPGKRNGKNS